MIAAPQPDEGVGQRLLENVSIAVPDAEAVDETMVVALGIERFRGALAGHGPVVMGCLRIVGAEVFFGDVGKDAQWFLFAVRDQFHLGVVFPGAERIFGLLRRIVVLLGHEGAGISDDAPEPIGTKPTHRERCGAAGTAADHGVAPRILGEGEAGISGSERRIADHGRQHFVVNETGEAVGHGVVFQAALALLAVIAAVLHGDRDKRGQPAVGVR